MLQGTATLNGNPVTVTKGRMNGDEITFVAGDQLYQGKVKGSRIEGTITTSSGKQNFSAMRR
jgi:hypothetical protein